MHLIVGTPDPGATAFPAELLRVGPERSLGIVAELVADGVGTEMITVSYDWRKALIDSYERGSTLTVVDFDRAAVVKKCRSPRMPGMGGMEAWLANSPELGPAYEGYSFAEPPNQPVVKGMALDPTVPCDKSFSTVDATDMRYVVAHGQPGVGSLIPPNWLHAGIPGGRLRSLGDMGYDVPAELRAGMEPLAGVALVISDSRALVLYLTSTDYRRRTLLYRKSDRTWRILKLPSEYNFMRGFGRFIGITQIETAPAGSAARSAGSQEWRKGPAATGPDLAARLRDYTLSGKLAGIFPGRLYIYDVDTERIYPIVTNQADSEVLLAEGSTVYYRVSDRLYAVEIKPDGLGAPKLLATADIIRDAHWAFTKR